MCAPTRSNASHRRWARVRWRFPTSIATSPTLETISSRSRILLWPPYAQQVVSERALRFSSRWPLDEIAGMGKEEIQHLFAQLHCAIGPFKHTHVGASLQASDGATYSQRLKIL